MAKKSGASFAQSLYERVVVRDEPGAQTQKHMKRSKPVQQKIILI